MKKHLISHYVFLTFACIVALSLPAQSSGRFQGRIITEPLPDGRNLRVVQPFTFIDIKGSEWHVPRNTVTDGASVPRFLWSIFPPFSGKYRIAAVVHDRYCQIRKKSWRSVHRMFFDAMIASGVDKVTARTMYAAVYSFGPRWSLLGATRAPKWSSLQDDQQAEAFEALQLWIARENPTRQEIESRIKETGIRELGAKTLE